MKAGDTMTNRNGEKENPVELLDRIQEIAEELKARYISNNTIWYPNTSWDSLCDLGSALFEVIKEGE